jgi:hypothetical protein
VKKQIDQISWNEEDNISLENQIKIKNFLKENADVFAINPKKPRKTSIVKHFINTGDHSPIKQRAYRVSPIENEIIKKEIKEMLENGIISPSKSLWASPVVLIIKKDGSIRFCIDYRKLNAITKKDVYPLPRIEDTLDRLRGMKYFSSLDLASGY